MPRKSRYPLQMPTELHERIKQEAAKADISVNEFIVNALTMFLDQGNEIKNRLDELGDRLSQVESLLLTRTDSPSPHHQAG